MCAFSLLLILLCVLEVRAQYGNGLTEGCAQQTVCAAGCVGNSMNGVCQQCGVGRYRNEGTQQACLLCGWASGKSCRVCNITQCECDVGATGANGGTCTLCGGGQYKNTSGSAACSDCEAGKDNGNRLPTCQTCASGQFSLGGTRCVFCPVGTASSTTGASSAAACVACAAGTFNDNTGLSACKLCYPDTSSTAMGATSAQSCVECGGGSTSTWGSSECVCDRGYYSANGLAPCTKCPAGSIAPNPSSTVCVACGDGFNDWNRWQCDECFAGTYRDSRGSAGCESCPPGSWSSVAAGACVACAAGTWSSMVGATSCSQCWLDKWSTATGATSIQTCVQCSEGSISERGSTECVCDKGYYSADGRSPCTRCPVGSIAPNTNSTECTACGSGFNDNGHEQCDACPLNSATDGVSRGPVGCACNVGFAGNSWDINVGGCRACATGKFKHEIGTSECVACAAGTFVTAVAASTCTRCAHSKYSTAAGATSPTTCAACAGDLWSTPGSNSTAACVCEAGKYSDGDAVCTECPVHTSSPAGSLSVAGCLCTGGFGKPQ
jgi:hypothetical protein